MKCVVALGVLFGTLATAALGADRLVEFQKLNAEYEAVAKEYFEAAATDSPTTSERIHRYEEWPGWRYIPQFISLAEAKPNDEAAFRCCQWIIDRTGNVGNEDKLVFEADQKVWEILAAHHTRRADLPMTCLRAVEYFGPAQERFLQGLLKRTDLSHENSGFATVALAEVLAHKYEFIELMESKPKLPPDEFTKYIERRKSADWGQDLTPANAQKFKDESIRLFREALKRYANVPVTISAPYFRDRETLGEKAEKSLHSLEHLTIGSEAPAIQGKDLNGDALNLADYRDNVVLLTFWSTGCGPCMEMIPHEQKLIKAYHGHRFALLSVCVDQSAAEGLKTAKDRGMDWPCWFDGENGPIARDYNALGLPTIYVINKTGLIVARKLYDDELDAKIAELMAEGK